MSYPQMSPPSEPSFDSFQQPFPPPMPPPPKSSIIPMIIGGVILLILLLVLVISIVDHSELLSNKPLLKTLSLKPTPPSGPYMIRKEFPGFGSSTVRAGYNDDDDEWIFCHVADVGSGKPCIFADGKEHNVPPASKRECFQLADGIMHNAAEWTEANAKEKSKCHLYSYDTFAEASRSLEPGAGKTTYINSY